MLIRFIVSNFLSFDTEQEFKMIAGNLKTHKEHVYHLPKINVLKAAAIYGANGAGKSNMVRAIEYFSNLIESGSMTRSINDKKFKLNPKNKNLPVTFEVEFFRDKKTYSYGLALNNMTIEEEWLVETDVEKEDKLIFERKLTKHSKTTIKVADKYQKTQKDKYLFELMEESLLKHHELLISKSDNLKIKEIKVLKEWNGNLSIIFPGSKFMHLVHRLATSKSFKAFSNDLLQTFDTGVRELDTEEIDFEKFISPMEDDDKEELMESLQDGKSVALIQSSVGPVLVSPENDKFIARKVVSRHDSPDGKSVNFDLEEESDGTQRLLDFIPAFSSILNSQAVIIVDEIDQSLHPVLLKALITKIMKDTKTQGQFIFTTHESNLLDLEIFRQDEIWFIEKDKKTGSSNAYSLLVFKPRYDLNIQKGYLKGRFGAIPFLANLRDLNWKEVYA
ncbi:AAA family ATPase [Mucilaginibacter flavidus]|uniref:AAA family ATPase n=1 Tax=Mucilaginibacter flavidus TaxID=2949309 RepID=UPI0020923E17|nr:ATP-binding protein [Mucilaginibacter flavidus]MCO5949522.1 ATP-binding protein [Mucilaginibacter flavidus]